MIDWGVGGKGVILSLRVPGQGVPETCRGHHAKVIYNQLTYSLDT